MLLIEWFNIFYRELKNFFDISGLLMVLAVGVFAFLVDYKSLQDKKLKKEAKLCRFIGAIYVIGGIGIYVVLKIF